MKRCGAGAAKTAGAGRTLTVLAPATALAVGVLVAMRVLVFVTVVMRVILFFMVVIGRRNSQSRGFVGQREERIALGTGKPTAALFAGKEHGETAGQKKTEEDGDRYDGHAWNVCPEYRLIPVG